MEVYATKKTRWAHFNWLPPPREYELPDLVDENNSADKNKKNVRSTNCAMDCTNALNIENMETDAATPVNTRNSKMDDTSLDETITVPNITSSNETSTVNTENCAKGETSTHIYSNTMEHNTDLNTIDGSKVDVNTEDTTILGAGTDIDTELPSVNTESTQDNRGLNVDTENLMNQPSPIVTNEHDGLNDTPVTLEASNVNTGNNIALTANDSNSTSKLNESMITVHTENNHPSTLWDYKDMTGSVSNVTVLTLPALQNNKVTNKWATTFSSDDSLFEEMTCQMNEKSTYRPNATSTMSTASGGENNDSLPDLVGGTSSKTDAIASLLMLGGAVNASIDDEIDNEKILPVNTLKKVDFAKELKEKEKEKEK